MRSIVKRVKRYLINFSMEAIKQVYWCELSSLVENRNHR